MISRVSLLLGVMGGVGGGRRVLSTGKVTLSRTSVRKMLLQDNDTQRKRSHLNFGLPRISEAATAVVERGSKKVKMPKHSSRLRTLSKTYLDKITDILSTGELASQLYGRGLEVSEVFIHPNLHGINVYWVTSGSPDQDHHTEALLHTHAKTIRHELSSLRIMGHSPPLTFIRDDRYHRLQEVERMLAVADFGEDFEPTHPAHHLKTHLPTLAMPLNTRIKSAIEGMEGVNGQEVKADPPDPFEEALKIATTDPPQGEGISDDTCVLPADLPALRGDVLGVNTTRIYTMIQQSMKRARAEHRRQHETGSQINPLDFHPQESISLVSRNRKSEIKQWASQYGQMQRKEARKKHKEDALLLYPGSFHTEDLHEEEIAVEWEENEDDHDEFQ